MLAVISLQSIRTVTRRKMLDDHSVYVSGAPTAVKDVSDEARPLKAVNLQNFELFLQGLALSITIYQEHTLSTNSLHSV